MNALNKQITAILLAGGSGSRMGGSTPKQFLLLGHKPIVQYSVDIFSRHPSISQLVIVCSHEYREHIDLSQINIPVYFAEPGERRQDSVRNGMECAFDTSDWICVHDTARPFITIDTIQRVIQAAFEVGAATAAVPCVNTIKEADENGKVLRTIKRETLWEIQTPQIIRSDWLEQGFEYAQATKAVVTDDVSFAELIGKPVKLVASGRENFKITLPLDMRLAESILYTKAYPL